MKRLSGQPDLWRLRVGDWRVLFAYDYDAQRIVVARLLPRGHPSER